MSAMYPVAAGPRPLNRDAARELERLPLDLPAAFVLPNGALETARLMNLSGKGVFLATPTPAPVGTRVEVTLALALESGIRHLRLPAEVRWVNGRSGFSVRVPPGMGLAFADLPENARDLVRRFIREQWTARRSAAAAARPTGDARQTRRYVLLDFRAHVERPDGRIVEARLVNLSGVGVFLAVEPPEPIGRELGLVLTLPYRGRQRSVRLVAAVRWVNEPDTPASPWLPPGMGLEFVRGSAAARRVLEEVLADFAAQAEGHRGL
jgi:uncharacterized protein (TIGR02266 family)